MPTETSPGPTFALVFMDTANYGYVGRLGSNLKSLQTYNRHHEFGLGRILYVAEAKGDLQHPNDGPLDVGDRCLVLAA